MFIKGHRNDDSFDIILSVKAGVVSIIVSGEVYCSRMEEPINIEINSLKALPLNDCIVKGISEYTEMVFIDGIRYELTIPKQILGFDRCDSQHIDELK